MPRVTSTFARVVEGRGPRVVERLLLAEVRRLAPRRPEDVHSPLRVVVPSGSLRLHLVHALVRDGGALVGVQVQTLFRVAAEILERAGEFPPAGEAAFELLVRRYAAADATLRDELAGMEDGFGAVAAAVRDLLDAGLGRVHTAAVLEKLDELGPRLAPGRLRRARAVVRVADRVGRELERTGALRRAGAPQRAADLLRDRGPELLPARAVVVTGYADATGVATELIQALLATIGGAVLLDRPPDPVAPDRDDAGAAFLDRFSSHLGGLARERPDDRAHDPVVDCLEAPGVDSELRAVAHRIRGLLDSGQRPEAVAVVARDIGYLATAVRRHFPRLAIPFSGGGSSVPGGGIRRLGRLLAALLSNGGDTPAELWLECLAERVPATDLLLALRTLGVTRLAEVARLQVESDHADGIPLPLPARAEDGEEERGQRLLAAGAVTDAVRRAATLVSALERWPDRSSTSGHLRATKRTLTTLGWDERSEEADEVLRCGVLLAAELPEETTWQRDEWQGELTRRLERLGSLPVGGAGGGVQVLSAVEARGRTFDHLFLVGLNRGVFPRIVEDDPMLPDQARGHLASDVLPDTPIKARGLDEERYLFAQLVASASRVTLSWSAAADAGRRAPSAFVERYRRELDPEVTRIVDPARLPDEAQDSLLPRPAVEHAVLAAQVLRRDRARLRPFLELAISEGQTRFAAVTPVPASMTAASRIDALAAADPPRATAGPGPWGGLVGRPDREDTPWVTGFEAIAACPFQALLTRRLGVAPMPDPRLGLPDPRGLLVGELVHAVLQRIVEEPTGRRRLGLEEALGLDPASVPWPPAETLESWLRRDAARAVRRRGLAGWGLEPLLVARARQCLAVARALDWPEGVASRVLAVEVTGEITLPGVEAPLRFRADRVDRGADGPLLVDYKTGGPLSGAIKPDTRRRHLLAAVARGGSLQAAAYALAVPGEVGTGRYLFLRPDIGEAPEEARDARVRADDGEFAGAFASAAATVARAWRTGACVPRVAEPGSDATPAQCRWCDVAEACLRDDSDYRRRIVSWMEGAAEPGHPQERAARELWWLGRGAPGDGG